VRDDDWAGFEDGRHRFAVLRDYGLATISIAMNPQSIANARRYGYLHHVYVAAPPSASAAVAPLNLLMLP
jgi:hypothetical protein